MIFVYSDNGYFQDIINHRDIINRLSIELDDNAQNFTVYADRLENKLSARVVQKLDFDDLRCWAFDLDRVIGKG